MSNYETSLTIPLAPPPAAAPEAVIPALSPSLARVLEIVARRTVAHAESGPASESTLAAITAEFFDDAAADVHKGGVFEKAGRRGGRTSATAKHLERLRALGLVFVWRSRLIDETMAIATDAGHDWVLRNGRSS